MEDLGIVSGGKDHLGLQARLQEEAVSRHRASATAGEGWSTVMPLALQTELHYNPYGRALLLALVVTSARPQLLRASSGWEI